MARQKKKLLWKLFNSHLLLTLLSIVAVLFVSYRTTKNFYYDQTQNELRIRAILFARSLPGNLSQDSESTVNTLCNTMGNLTETRITVILRNGTVIGDSDEDYRIMENHADRPELREAFAGRTGATIRFSATLRKELMYVAVPFMENGYVTAAVRTSIPLVFLTSDFRSIFYGITVITCIIAFATVLFSYFLARRISKPIKEMIVCAGEFAGGNLNLRMPVSETEEIGELALAMNTMAVELEDRIKTITERRNELEAILAGMVEAVFSVDSEERIIEFNEAAERMFHVTRKQVKGRYVRDVIKTPSLQHFVSRTLLAGSFFEDEVSLHDAEERILQAHGTPLRNATGETIGSVIVLNDITRIKQLENIRRDFVANVSHELKTPITSIIGFVETLRDGAIEDTKNRKQFLKIILKHAERLNGIIEDLLSLSRIEQQTEAADNSISENNLLDILIAAISLCQTKANDKKISIILDCPDISITCNPSLIEQAVVNLIDNAIKYSDKKSQITVRGYTTSSQVLVDVTDNGYGIPHEHIGRIFERFYRIDKSRSRALGGTGLGLAIVKHIVLIHGGTVSVESTPGEGSTFTIALPLS